MRIAIVSPFYPYRGGISQFSDMLFAEFHKLGCDVKGFNFKRLYPDVLFPGKTQYVDSPQQNAVEHIRCLDSINPVSYNKTVAALKEYAPDVLIISYWMSFFVPAYAHIAYRMKKQCKVVALIHNAIPHEPHFFDKPLASFFFKQCDHFVVLSENVEKDVIQLCPAAKVLRTPHPLYTQFGDKISKEEACERLGIAPDKKTLLFFGLIRDYKGLDLLIEAMDSLSSDYQLLIAGESYGSFDRYYDQINKVEARSRIFIHNQYIKDEDIPIFFSASDILVLPYRSATQSGVLSVAYHYNLPIVATPVGDFKETIASSRTGLVASEVSSSSLAECIDEVFKPENLPLFIKNIDHLKDELSWETFAKKVVQTINA